jgi:hypothetical protein
VTAVLAECGNDIDAAIRRLNQLRIESDAAAAAAAAAPAAASRQQQVAAGPAAEQQQQQQEQQQAAATAAAQQQQQQQQQQAGATPSGGAPAGAAPAEGPQTAEQWVDALVGEMAAASSIPDARGRAAKLLHAFERFVQDRGAGGRGGGPRLEEALRENAILKRAVQIQNARMQEAGAKEQELAALKQAVAQYQERLRHLELSNYSLALHLQKATGDAPVAPGHRPPDVY